MVQLVKQMPLKYEGLSLSPQNSCRKKARCSCMCLRSQSLRGRGGGRGVCEAHWFVRLAYVITFRPVRDTVSHIYTQEYIYIAIFTYNIYMYV